MRLVLRVVRNHYATAIRSNPLVERYWARGRTRSFLKHNANFLRSCDVQTVARAISSPLTSSSSLLFSDFPSAKNRSKRGTEAEREELEIRQDDAENGCTDVSRGESRNVACILRNSSDKSFSTFLSLSLFLPYTLIYWYISERKTTLTNSSEISLMT